MSKNKTTESKALSHLKENKKAYAGLLGFIVALIVLGAIAFGSYLLIREYITDWRYHTYPAVDETLVPVGLLVLAGVALGYLDSVRRDWKEWLPPLVTLAVVAILTQVTLPIPTGLATNVVILVGLVITVYVSEKIGVRDWTVVVGLLAGIFVLGYLAGTATGALLLFAVVAVVVGIAEALRPRFTVENEVKKPRGRDLLTLVLSLISGVAFMAVLLVVSFQAAYVVALVVFVLLNTVTLSAVNRLCGFHRAKQGEATEKEKARRGGMLGKMQNQARSDWKKLSFSGAQNSNKPYAFLAVSPDGLALLGVLMTLATLVAEVIK